MMMSCCCPSSIGLDSAAWLVLGLLRMRTRPFLLICFVRSLGCDVRCRSPIAGCIFTSIFNVYIVYMKNNTF